MQAADSFLTRPSSTEIKVQRQQQGRTDGTSSASLTRLNICWRRNSRLFPKHDPDTY